MISGRSLKTERSAGIRMTKRILFVNGPSQDPSDRFFGWPTSLLYGIGETCKAIDAGHIDYSYSGRIFDPIWYVDELNGENVRAALREALWNVDIVCASVTYDALFPTLELLRAARTDHPALTVILGGPHIDEAQAFDALRSECLRIADYLIAGDGEFALVALLKALSFHLVEPSDFVGVAGRFTVYDRCRRIADGTVPLLLDRLDFIRLDLADVFRHKHDFDVFTDDGEIAPTAQMIARRGCSYRCDYCSERADLAYPNARSIDNILAEIDLRRSQGFKAVFFDDSTFGQYPRLRELLTALGGTGLRFGCLNRFNHLVDPSLLEAYRAAGFEYFYCAIEQFDDRTLTLVRKDQSTASIGSAMRLLHEQGFAVGVSLLYGLPSESQEGVLRTIDFTAEWAARGTIKLVSQSVLTLHPGTPLGQRSRVMYDRPAPNRGYPFDRFEEGQWEHLPHVTSDYLEDILHRSEERFAGMLVRNRHSWYARTGLVPDSAAALQETR